MAEGAAAGVAVPQILRCGQHLGTVALPQQIQLLCRAQRLCCVGFLVATGHIDVHIVSVHKAGDLLIGSQNHVHWIRVRVTVPRQQCRIAGLRQRGVLALQQQLIVHGLVRLVHVLGCQQLCVCHFNVLADDYAPIRLRCC